MRLTKMLHGINGNVFLISIFMIISIINLNSIVFNTIAENNSYGEVTIELSPDNPAKNQEVLLSINVIDFRELSVSNLSLNITLTSLTTPPRIIDMPFLNDQNPKTDENGIYETIFNAPTFSFGRDAYYEINVKVRLKDDHIITAKFEFHVQEKKYDTEKDINPKHAAPGAWYSIILYNIDFKHVTISITQNGVSDSKSWDVNDWESGGGLYEGDKNTGEEKAIHELHYIENEFYELIRLDGDSQTLMSMQGYPDKTLIYRFLVTEIFENYISIKFSIYVNDQQIDKKYEIPTLPLYRPTYGITERLGKWFFSTRVLKNDQHGTYQNNDVLIYGIGFKDKVKLKIFNTTNVIYEEIKTQIDFITLFKWHVPKNVSIGYYGLLIEGNNLKDKKIQHEIKFYIEKEPKKSGGIHGVPILSSEFFKLFLYIFIGIIIIIVLGTLSYTRLKRKKLLNHLIRKKIYEHIQLNPGIHFRALLNNLQLNTGTLTHHLKILEREQFIRENQDGMYRRFFLFNETPTKKFNLPNIQETLLTIIKENPGITQSNISKKTGNSRSNVNYHIKILNDGGMISVIKQGRISQCYLSK